MLIGMLDMTRPEALASAACGQNWLRSIIEQKALTLLFLLLVAVARFFARHRAFWGWHVSVDEHHVALVLGHVFMGWGRDCVSYLLDCAYGWVLF